MQEAYTLTVHIKVRRKTVIPKSVKSWEILVCRSKISEAKITLQDKGHSSMLKNGADQPMRCHIPSLLIILLHPRQFGEDKNGELRVHENLHPKIILLTFQGLQEDLQVEIPQLQKDCPKQKEPG